MMLCNFLDPRGHSFLRRMLRSGAVCCVALILSSGCGKGKTEEGAATSTEGKTQANSTAATATASASGAPAGSDSAPAETPQGMLEQSAVLVEKGEMKPFIERYFPAKMVKQMKSSPQWNEEIPADFIAAFKTIAPRIRAYAASKPEMSADGTKATFKLNPAAEKEEPENSTSIPAPQPVAATGGFGGDLAKALSDAAAALEKKDYAGFVDKMFPPTQLAVIDRDGGRDRYLLRLSDNPKMAERMIADLKLAQAAKPTMSSDGNTATVEVTSVDKDGPVRKFVFQKVSGNWRLHDSAEKTHQEIARISGLAPIKIKNVRDVPKDLVLIREGNEWRFENPNVIEPGR